MLNNVSIQGRLTKDIDLKFTAKGDAVTTFTLAVERDNLNRETQKRDVDFLDVVAWRKTAEHAFRWFKKGNMMAVKGKIQVRTWKDNEEKMHRNAEIIAENIYFCGESYEAKKLDDEDFEELKEDETLPF